MSFNGVLINNADSARTAVEYLIDKGHRRIGYLRGAFRIKAFRSRETGFRVALQGAGIPVDENMVVTLSTTMDGAYRDMKKYLADAPVLPTAFFADNDMVALGAMKAMEEAGIRIPDQVSIIGFDDLPFCEIVSPRLSTIRVSKQEMGQVAVRRVMEIAQDPEGSKLKIQLCTQFVERDSVRKITEKE
jgi:LacI family transcriptional regulator